MYALVTINGKQYKAEQGSLLKVDKVGDEKGTDLQFDSVLFAKEGDSVKIGSPYVDGVVVKTTVEDHVKGKKIVIYKFKKRKGYRRKQGHRQQYSLLRVNEIAGI